MDRKDLNSNKANKQTTVLSLSVRFDQRITFSRHVDDVTQKRAGLLCGLSHSQHCLPDSILVTIVQSLVVSPAYAIVWQCMEVRRSPDKAATKKYLILQRGSYRDGVDSHMSAMSCTCIQARLADCREPVSLPWSLPTSENYQHF